MVSVIIVAAGNSSRAGGINKQFLEIGGLPVLVRSVSKFEQIPEVIEIIIVTKQEDIPIVEKMMAIGSFSKVKAVVSGGQSRQQSVINGFLQCDQDAQLVMIHDGARPFVTPTDIQNAIIDAKIHQSATLGVPVKDTIKVVVDGLIQSTPSRDTLFITQTPQVFAMDLYRRAVESAERDGVDLTDDCQLVERIGAKVHMTIGSYTNIKITTPEDIVFAKTIAMEELV